MDFPRIPPGRMREADWDRGGIRLPEKPRRRREPVADAVDCADCVCFWGKRESRASEGMERPPISTDGPIDGMGRGKALVL
jgi:hypothetical protein